jgi:hypothetical protein
LDAGTEVHAILWPGELQNGTAFPRLKYRLLRSDGCLLDTEQT